MRICGEWICREAARCEIRAAKISPDHPGASNPDLTFYAYWAGLAVTIDDIYLARRQGSADVRRRLVAAQARESRIYRRLGRSVNVIERNVRRSRQLAQTLAVNGHAPDEY